MTSDAQTATIFNQRTGLLHLQLDGLCALHFRTALLEKLGLKCPLAVPDMHPESKRLLSVENVSSPQVPDIRKLGLG